MTEPILSSFPPPSEPRMGRWQARTLRRAAIEDAILVAALLVVACCTVLAGRAASLYLSTESAADVAKALADLELPGRLPNARLLDEQGKRQGLLTRMKRTRAVVAFYASWCGPCQKELPELYRRVDEDNADLFVVISKNEDGVDTRRKLDNLGLEELGFFVDETDGLHRSARVTSLPTTFAITKHGTVLARATGYSAMGLWRLMNKANLGSLSENLPRRTGATTPAEPEKPDAAVAAPGEADQKGEEG